MRAPGWEQLIGSFSSLRVRSRGNSVWLLTAPTLFNRGKAKQERGQLLNFLSARAPSIALWSSPSLDSYYQWSFPDPAQLENIVKPLYYGEWVLFFFAERPELSSPPFKTAPSTDNELDQLVSHLGARAVILSLVDDDEWLIAINGGTDD